MKAKKLKIKYTYLWEQVEDGVLNDLNLQEEGLNKKQKERIAHNAAFIACHASYKRKEMV